MFANSSCATLMALDSDSPIIKSIISFFLDECGDNNGENITYLIGSLAG